MRDGPPPIDESMSAEVLLKEIANLRSRLRDLEEDGRSSFCESFIEGDVALYLKKEVVKLADEKAKQEKEFMNQLSSLAIENQSIIANLKSKLARGRAEQEDLEDRLETLTNSQNCEIDRLKQSIARGDEEIAVARQELDFLHQEIEELQQDKKVLAHDAQAIRLELENEKRRSESFHVQLKKSESLVEQLRAEISPKDNEIQELREEVGEMNDAMIQLEEAKEMALGQLKAVKAELAQAKHKLQREKTKSIDHSIVSAERETLERANEQLEERLERFQSKLAEKDATIETLTQSLKEERNNCRKIRQEWKEERENQTESRDESGLGLSRSLHGAARDPNKEIDFLRRRNKALNEEVKELRKKVSESGAIQKESQRDGHFASNKDSSLALGATTTTTPPRLKNHSDVPVSPRTAVSGLVASFERRIHRKGDERREGGGSSPCGAADFSPPLGRSTELREAQQTIQHLEFELQEEREIVSNLRRQLGQSMESSGNEMVALERQLEKSQDLVETLKKRVTFLEKEKEQCSSEIEQLQYDLNVSKELAAMQAEKKEEDREEEVTRLRSQVGALQSELSSAMEQIEDLNKEIAALMKELDDEKLQADVSLAKIDELKTQVETAKKDSSVKERSDKVNNAEINKLKVELTKVQVAKDKLESELSNCIRELETEIEAVEIEANQEIDQLKSEISTLQLSVSRKEQENRQLEAEKNQLCNSMSMASNAKNNDFEELQSELLDKTAQNTSQAREIQALKMKIEELENVKRGKAERLQNRVGELEQEIEILRRSTKNSGGSWEDMERLRRENLQLKESIRETKMERRNLQDRIESLVGERSSSKSVQILRERNATLKEEVEKLTRRLKKMEESITRFAI